MKPLLIVGAGKTADVVIDAVRNVGEHEPVALAVDSGFEPEQPHWSGLPVLCMDEAVRQFPPSEALAFVAIGYHECNNVRAERMTDLASAGYMLASLVSPRAYVPSNFVANANCLITDGAVVQTGARLGMGCFVFGNAVVGHHASIGKAVWIASGAAIGGGASIGDHSFIGLNATIGNEVKLGRRSIVGGGALITRSVPDETVLVAPESERLRVDTTRFLRFTNLQ